MTTRLYFTDSYLTAFDAQLLERTMYDDSPAVVLDQSCFYPTSGGQPHDTGTLNEIPVVEVVIREPDGVVLHVLKGELNADQVSGKIDWERRFDHMQHHTGQHILSQAFVQLAQAETVGFHMSPDSVTIDLDTPDIKPAAVDAVETLANRIVTDNRPVNVCFPSEEELTRLQLRKVPEVDIKLRVVDIEGFDVNACGGTHVAHTGEVGLIKILRVERRGDIARVEFQCGGRALRDYHHKHAVLSQLAAELTTGYTGISAVLQKLREENKTLQRELRTLRAALLEQEAEQLWQSADRTGLYALVVLALENRDLGDARQLVQKLIAHPATIVLCGVAGEKAQLIMARSDDLPYDMVPVLLRGLAVWGINRGGGRPSFAQGGGASASIEQIRAALSAAVEVIRSANR